MCKYNTTEEVIHALRVHVEDNVYRLYTDDNGRVTCPNVIEEYLRYKIYRDIP
jgi:hypothetical protein